MKRTNETAHRQPLGQGDFLESSDEDVLNSDRAVAEMEQLAAELRLMLYEVKNGLARRLQEPADEYGIKASVVAKLGETFGLV